MGVDGCALLIKLPAGSNDPSCGVLLRMSFEGASASVELEGLDPRPGRHHFFLGDDATRWVTDVRSYERVRLRDLYPGINLVLRCGEVGFEYDLIAAAGADLAQVVVRVAGADRLRYPDERTLVLDTAVGPMRQPIGRTWQEIPGVGQQELEPRYRRIDEERFGFSVPGWDSQGPLTIDPGLLWSTYLGTRGSISGGLDLAHGVAWDPLGNVTVVGRTEGIPHGGSFPMTPGAYQAPGPPFFVDTFVTRFRQSDGTLVYSCLIGGNSHKEDALDVAVDGLGRATVVGRTSSRDFPTTRGAFDEEKNSFQRSAFALRLSPDGSSLEYSTVIEGTAVGSEAWAVSLTKSGDVVLGGFASPGFPTTPGAFAETIEGGQDAFIARLDSSGARLQWSTCLGGDGLESLTDLALDDQENVTVVGNYVLRTFPVTPGAYQQVPASPGSEPFIARLTADGSTVIWATLLGGVGTDFATALALTRTGDVIVGGRTGGAFPITPDALLSTSGGRTTGFVSRLDATGSTLLHSTYLGSLFDDDLGDLHVDASGLVTVTGKSAGTYPITPGAHRTQWMREEAFIARLDPELGRLFYSSYVGGSGDEEGRALAVAPDGRVTLAGFNQFAGFPTTENAFQRRSSGGASEVFVVTMDLRLQGISFVGTSRPACLGPIQMNATQMPVAGASAFSFYCSGAPPLTEGLLILGTSDRHPFAHSVLERSAHEPSFQSIHVKSDAAGFIETPVPLPANLVGASFLARYVFPDSTGCPTSYPWSTSNGLRVTVQ